MRLYVHPASYCSARALAVAHQVEAAVEVVVVDLLRGEQRGPEYLRLNPMGRVPLLVMGDEVLPESAAIMWTLAERAGALLPTTPTGRAAALRWISWDLAHLGRAHDRLLHELVVKGFFHLGDPDAALVAQARAEGDAAAAILDAALAHQAWLAGDQVSVADLFVAATIRSGAGLGAPWATGRHTARWLAAVEALPGCAAARAHLQALGS